MIEVIGVQLEEEMYTKNEAIDESEENYIREAYKGKNCTNCKFARVQDNGDVQCTKQEFAGKDITIQASKVTVDCPAHSEYNRYETRYGHPNTFVFDSDDMCAICHRDLLNSAMTRKDKRTHRAICVVCASQSE